MKKVSNVVWASLCLVMMFAFTACDSDDDPVANVPALSGTINFDRTRAGVGQVVTMSFALPGNLSPDVEKAEYYFNLGGAVNINSTPIDKVCSLAYSFSTAGQYQITFGVRYIFKTPDANGQIYRDDEITKTLSVVDCDARNSFWGDNLAETEKNCNTQLTQTSENIYSAILPASFGKQITVGGNGSETKTIYSFINNGLNSVIESNQYQIENPFRHFFQYYVEIKRAYGEESADRLWLPDENFEDAALNAYMDDYINNHTAASLETLNNYLSSGGGVGCSFQKGDTRLSLTCSYEEGILDVNISYTKK